MKVPNFQKESNLALIINRLVMERQSPIIVKLSRFKKIARLQQAKKYDQLYVDRL